VAASGRMLAQYLLIEFKIEAVKGYVRIADIMVIDI
jgi:hypothetical protein